MQKKGPYFAAVGDFGSVAASHTRLVDEPPAQATVTIGADGYQDLSTGGTIHLGGGRRLLAAANVSHCDGPWHDTLYLQFFPPARNDGTG